MMLSLIETYACINLLLRKDAASGLRSQRNKLLLVISHRLLLYQKIQRSLMASIYMRHFVNTLSREEHEVGQGHTPTFLPVLRRERCTN